MTDIWVCTNCHSLNRQRATKCYKCGTPQSQASMEGIGDRRVTQAVQTRTLIPYRSSWFRAVIAGVLILALAGWSLYLLLVSLDDYALVRDLVRQIVAGVRVDVEVLDAAESAFARLGLIYVGLGIATLVAFGAWLSRVVMNVPALGGGEPDITPTRAFLYPLIPVVNLVRVPGAVNDVLYRLSPTGGGFFLIAIAWIGLVGSAVVSFVVDLWIDLRIATGLPAIQTLPQFGAFLGQLLDIALVTDIVVTIASVVGGLILALVIVRVELRAWARDREIRAAVGV